MGPYMWLCHPQEDLEQPAPPQEDKAAKAEEEVAEEAKSGGD